MADPVLRACRDLADAILGGCPLREMSRYVEAIATGWARAGIPLEWIHRQLWESVKHAARGRDDLATLMDTVTTVLAAVSTTYLGELRGRHRARERLMSALLTGADTTVLARECGLTVAETYSVLAVAFPVLDPHTDPANAVARLGAELAHRFESTALARLSGEGGTILVPAPREDAALDQLVGQLADTAGFPLTAATTTAPPAELPEAAGRAHELLDVAVLFGREGALHRLGDLAAEYQLTRPGPARDQLAAVLDPLDRSPHLITTLRLHLRGTLGRRAIARHLNVHANTVEYRLKRIAVLTGLDPLSPAGQWRLRCALVARRCSPADSPEPALP
ncbi:PucR family transcriptional regulator [Nocardia sp. NPDC003482]